MCRLLSLLLAVPALSDYPYYSDYSDPYSSVSHYASNLTGFSQRVFDPEYPLVVSISTTLKIPLPDLDTTLSVGAPFSFPIGEAAGRSSGFAGRAMDHRQGLYNALSMQLGQVTGSDGHSCLLRAICEVAMTPNHGDGLWGEMINLVLSASSSLGREMGEVVGPKYKKYLDAQSLGESGDCSSLHKACPMSLFNIL